MATASIKCRARGGAAACVDPNCPEKKHARLEFFKEISKQQQVSLENPAPLSEAYKASKKELGILTNHQREAIRFFSHIEFGWINGHLYGDKRYNLRHGNEPYENCITGSLETYGIAVFETRTLEHFAEITAHLDAAMKSASRTNARRKVYRGQSDIAFNTYAQRPVSESAAGRAKKWLRTNIEVGQELSFAGYQSTSLNPAIAARYAGVDGLLFEITTSEGINITSVSTHKAEQEVLLPRNARYKVLEVCEDVAVKLKRGSKKVNLVRLEAI